MNKRNLHFLMLLFVTSCFIISCDKPKNEEIKESVRIKSSDFTKSMTFKYEDIDKVIIYSFLNKSL